MTTAIEERSPKLTKVLQNATKDLEYAEPLPGIVSKVLFNPVREGILIPVASKATEVVSHIPLPEPIDALTSVAAGISVGVVKFGYSVLPHGAEWSTRRDDEETNGEVEDIINKDFQQMNEFAKKFEPKDIVSSLLGVVGFATNSAIDILSLARDGKFLTWNDAIVKFIGFLAYTGIGKELKGFVGLRAFERLIIIAKGQRERIESRRDKVALNSYPDGVDKDSFKKIMKGATRYVRYATAAYGTCMIDSANVLQVRNNDVIYIPFLEKSSERLRKRKIVRYLNLKDDGIKSMTNPGGSMKILGHFVAVEHKDPKSVVLAIRGTYTPSGLLVDVTEADSQPYCDGFAHAGMAKRADKLWEVVKGLVCKLLRENECSTFIITGHSLGAGVAALLSLKINYERLLAKEDPDLTNIDVRCFAFAPPPVYFRKETNEKLQFSMSKIHSFLHENDCVPFASVDAVRRLAATMDDVSKDVKGFDTPLIAAGLKPIPEELEDKIVEARKVSELNDSKTLFIPSPYVMWFQRSSFDKHDRPVYLTSFCRTKAQGELLGTNNLNVYLHENMISDHMIPGYERAANSVLAQIIRGGDGLFEEKDN